MEQIVITGAAGKIGRLLTLDLARDYDVRGLDRKRRSGPLLRREDTRRVGATAKALTGAQTVIDLAGDPDHLASWKTVRRQNAPAALGTLEAARRAGVRRVIYASSGHVMGLYDRDEPYASICAGRYEAVDRSAIPMLTSSFPIRPDGPYGVGKAMGEAAARFYADEFGMSIICLRIGAVYADNRPKSPRGFAIMLTHADLLRLIRKCVTAPPEVGFAILNGVSANTWRYWDIEEARRVVGYEPLENAEQWRKPA